MSKDSIRKTRSDGDKTKERILKAALALFAKHGFAETENKEIAKKAKVDIARSTITSAAARDCLKRF